MTIDEMIAKKKEYGFSCEYIAQKAGVPFSTVQKVFSKLTPAPRRKTIEALKIFFESLESNSAPNISCCNVMKHEDTLETAYVCEESMEYGSVSGTSALKSDMYDMSEISSEKSVKRGKKAKTGDKTLEDYLALPEGVRVELIDGIFYDMAAPTSPHTYVALEIRDAFKDYIKANKGDCVPMAAPVDVQLDCDDKTVVQPDVMVICERNKITKQRVVGAPDLIVEVLSPSNWSHDMVRKLEKYKKAGVREYWIVNLEEQYVLIYDFAKSDFPVRYDFDDEVPVGIWDGKCKVDFREIYKEVEFML